MKRSRRPIPPKSAKTIERDAELAAMTARMLGADNRCHVRSPLCTGVASCLHHIAARSVAPHRVLDERNVIRSCHPCNQYIETAPGAAWAEARGLKKRSWE